MSTASNDDLSVRLDWPVDPLAPEPTSPRDDAYTSDPTPAAPVETRFELLEELPPRSTDAHDDLPGAVEEIAERLDQVALEVRDALRRASAENLAAIEDRIANLRTAIMSMLASRQTEDQNSQRRERETLMSNVTEEMSVISRTLTEAVATSRAQGDVFADKVAAELQALRRRIPVKGKSSGIDDATMDELVTRVADEVEIRVAAALKPKPTRRKG